MIHLVIGLTDQVKCRVRSVQSSSVVVVSYFANELTWLVVDAIAEFSYLAECGFAMERSAATFCLQFENPGEIWLKVISIGHDLLIRTKSRNSKQKKPYH